MVCQNNGVAGTWPCLLMNPEDVVTFTVHKRSGTRTYALGLGQQGYRVAQ
jgi:hypothetical protein